MNTHTPGPLHIGLRPGPFLYGPKGEQVADLRSPAPLLPHEETRANMALLRNSYNAFDKAARKLGIDAGELAETIDLAALIKAAREVIDELDHDTLGADTSARVLALEGLLNRLPKVERV